MGDCGCKKNIRRFEVVTEKGAVAYSTNSETTARAVARRYKGSTVREKTPAKTG